jgi:hypothetical protein
MIEISNHIKNIVSSDIWEHEKNEYLNSFRTDKHMIFLMQKLSDLIIKTRNNDINNKGNSPIRPLVTIEDYDDGSKKGYWLKCLEQIIKAETIKERMILNFFSRIDNGIDSMFSYAYPIEVDKDDNYFDYWFSLKLAHYKNDLGKIVDFINFQLNLNFNNDKEKFIEFLELILLQHNNFIDDRINKVCNNWIAKNKIKEIIAPVNFKKHPKFQNDYRTFYLKILSEKTLFFTSAEILLKFSDLLQSFKNLNVISEETKPQMFMNIFKSEEIDSDQKIIWTGTCIQLKWFIDAIVKSELCEDLKGLDKWLVTQKCFKLKKKNGEILEIEKYTQISDATGKVTDLKEQIEKLVMKLEEISNYTPTGV